MWEILRWATRDPQEQGASSGTCHDFALLGYALASSNHKM